jgi:hypothetical protein
MEPEWDELLMVDNVVAESQRYSLPYKSDEAQDDLDDLVARRCLVIDEDQAEAEGLDGIYEEEVAIWIGGDGGGGGGRS